MTGRILGKQRSTAFLWEWASLFFVQNVYGRITNLEYNYGYYRTKLQGTVVDKRWYNINIVIRGK